MDLIEQNFATILVVIGTLGGALIGMLGILYAKKVDLKYKHLEWQKDYLNQYVIQPIISFLDDSLSLIELVILADQPVANIDFKTEFNNSLKVLYKKQGSVLPRVKSIRDEEIFVAFSKFNKEFQNFTDTYSGNHTEREILDILGKIEEHAAIIIRRLGDLLSTPRQGKGL